MENADVSSQEERTNNNNSNKKHILSLCECVCEFFDE